MVSRVLGALRLHLGRELDLIDQTAQRFLWVTDFPMFEWDPEVKRWDAVHHPVHAAEPPRARRSSTPIPGAAKAIAYDLVANGIEIAGGSFRIHEPELQAKVFGLLNISPEEQRTKFGFLLDALAMGAPPHGGIASGIDRLMMALLDEPYIRELVAFPKNQAGVDPMSGAPTPRRAAAARRARDRRHGGGRLDRCSSDGASGGSCSRCSSSPASRLP